MTTLDFNSFARFRYFECGFLLNFKTALISASAGATQGSQNVED